jgi:HlyD family secretion protein
VRVDETSIAAIEAAQRALVRVQAYEDELFEGVVQSVALAATEEKDGSKYYKVEVLLKNNGRQVLSGLNADVDIETRRHEDILKIPSQAVLGRRVDDLPVAVRDAPQVDKDKALCPVVFRVVDGKAVITPVQVGPSDLTHTVILSGLSENDPIITGPYKVFEKLADAQKVKDEKSATTQPSGKDSAVAKGNSQSVSAR